MITADFTEQRFEALPKYRESYNNETSKGYQTMAKRSAVICGLARNLGTVLPITLQRIENTGKLFERYHVVIYENDSVDNTKNILNEWNFSRNNATILTEDLYDPVNPGTRCLLRAGRMAGYRNKCHDYIASHLSDYSHVITIDMDLADGWSLDGLANTFGKNEWDYVGANSLLYIQRKNQKRCVYYDAWAFRKYGHPEPHRADEVNPMQLKRGEPLIPVFSCFGGLGVYKTEAYLSTKYSGGDCEHVPFHLGMRAKGFVNQYLNPSQITLYGTRHQ